MPCTISFHLKEPKVDRPTAIFIWFYANGQRTRIYTGERIHPEQWDKAEQKARTRGRGINATENGSINTSLARMGELLKTYGDEVLARGIQPTAEQLRRLVEVQPEADAEQVITVLAEMNAYIERRSVKSRPNTSRNIRMVATRLATYERDVLRHPISFHHLTYTFFDKYLMYLSASVGLLDNSVHRHLAIIKAFLQDASDRGQEMPDAYKRASWNCYDPEIIPLTRAELAALEAVALNHVPLINARALFLLGCYTGLRYSDVMALRPEHDLGDRLRVTTQKTDEAVVIPLNPKARPLVDQVRSGAVWAVANKTLNEQIRQVAALAGLTAAVEQVVYKGGQRTTFTLPKFQAISTHTARRTFVTLALEDGLPWEVVMKVSGHKQMRTFQRYIKVTENRQVEAFQKLWEGSGQ